MRWLNSNFGDRRHGVVAVVDYTFAARAEVNDLWERMRLGAIQRTLELKGRIWRSGIADLSGTGRKRRSRVESVGRRGARAGGECCKMQVVDFGGLADLNQAVRRERNLISQRWRVKHGAIPGRNDRHDNPADRWLK